MTHKNMRSGLLVSALALGTLLAGAQAAHGQGRVDRNHVPSKERVDKLERRSDQIDGNNVRATITNWNQTAQDGAPGAMFYEWPINTGRRYVALTRLWVGAEVRDDEGNTLWIVDVADARANLEGEQNSWTFEPIKGYVNPRGAAFGLAQSDDPESWPDCWPDKQSDPNDPGWCGSWNGLFGKDVFNADQEFYYRAGDNEYDRYPTYFPDSTDLTRKGLGLIVESRILAWSQILIDDVVFVLHGIKNDGTEDLDKVGVTLWLADLVGGDAQDDVPSFDLLEDVALMTDRDRIGDQFFGSDPVGVAAISFLETPGNAVDRIDNDGDGTTAIPVGQAGEPGSPSVTEEMLEGECPADRGATGTVPTTCYDGVDNNLNGLVDENKTHVPFGSPGGVDFQAGVGFADFIDNDGDGEQGGPVVTAEMAAAASSDRWQRWPLNPENDAMQAGLDGRPIVHLSGLDAEDVGAAFRDNIDNDDSAVSPTAAYPYLSEPGSPVVTLEMIASAATDAYGRFRVNGTDVILYDVGAEDLGKPYADGVDNDGDGAVDEGIDEGIDEMIDESRADGIDNDGDWRALMDDTGLDGVPFSGDAGDSDGQPTSGAGTDLPGERNIDVTDVSESDQIGITNVQYKPAFFINHETQSDRFTFNTFMVPGDFYDPTTALVGDYDLFVSSGVFPLKAGQTERISFSVQLGQDRAEALRARDNALDAYAADYQFAQAPTPPVVTAVPGNGRVTLYWDAAAEDSYDSFLADLGLEGRDFQGYRIYRATDPAFLDARVITDAFGNRQFRKPIAQFDLIDSHGGPGPEGFHPVAVNGTQFYLGNNTQDPGEAANGLTHMFVDSTVTNGVTYYYAVTSYDFGSTFANIPPSESTSRIRRLPDGSVETGRNVVEVVPNAPVAGFENADIEELTRTKGYTSSRIGYEIVDPTAVQGGHRYRIVFEDSLISGGANAPDTLKTKNFSLIDLADGDTVIARSDAFQPGVEFPVHDDSGRSLGFALQFFPDPDIILNQAESGWRDDPDNYPLVIQPYVAAGYLRGFRNPADYRVEVVGEGAGTSTAYRVRNRPRPVDLPARPTNVRVYNVSTGQEVKYAFWDLTGEDASPTATTPATFSADPAFAESDRIIIIEPKVGDPAARDTVTWQISMDFVQQDKTNPEEGDVADLKLRKPFLSTDEFEFLVRGASVDTAQAKAGLDRVQVVPNPYVVTNRFETQNPFSTGRGPRVIRFINLPPRATVRIFTVGGQFVRELSLNDGANEGLTAEDLMNGTLVWDVESEEDLSVSYGVYVYHVEAPGIGEKTGTFAIIK